MALYQQGQKIEVIVRKEDLTAATAGANEKPAEQAGQNPQTTSGTGAETDGRESRISARITGTKLLAATVAMGRLGLNYYAGGIGYRTGDSAQQEAVQRNFEIAEEGIGVLASVGIGVLYGARGGAVGMAVGGVLAAATTAVSLSVKYGGRYREYNAKMFKEENAIEYKRARANLSLTTGRLR